MHGLRSESSLSDKKLFTLLLHNLTVTTPAHPFRSVSCLCSRSFMSSLHCLLCALREPFLNLEPCEDPSNWKRGNTHNQSDCPIKPPIYHMPCGIKDVEIQNGVGPPFRISFANSFKAKGGKTQTVPYPGRVSHTTTLRLSNL